MGAGPTVGFGSIPPLYALTSGMLGLSLRPSPPWQAVFLRDRHTCRKTIDNNNLSHREAYACLGHVLGQKFTGTPG